MRVKSTKQDNTSVHCCVKRQDTRLLKSEKDNVRVENNFVEASQS